MTEIIISGLTILGRHGVRAQERQTAQLFNIDLRLVGAFAQRDHLKATVDYVRVARRVRALSDARSFRLIESFAQAIARALLNDFPSITRVRVRVRKLRPALPVGLALRGVGAEVLLDRAGTGHKRSVRQRRSKGKARGRRD